MSSSNNPNGRPKGSLNKKRQHFFDMAAKHGLDIAEFLVLVATGKSKELGLVVQDDYTEEGQVAPVIIPFELRFDAVKTLAKMMYAPPRANPHENDDEDGKSNVMRLAYKLDVAPEITEQLKLEEGKDE